MKTIEEIARNHCVVGQAFADCVAALRELQAQHEAELLRVHMDNLRDLAGLTTAHGAVMAQREAELATLRERLERAEGLLRRAVEKGTLLISEVDALLAADPIRPSEPAATEPNRDSVAAWEERFGEVPPKHLRELIPMDPLPLSQRDREWALERAKELFGEEYQPARPPEVTTAGAVTSNLERGANDKAAALGLPTPYPEARRPDHAFEEDDDLTGRCGYRRDGILSCGLPPGDHP